MKCIIINLIAATISFSQSVYNINEDEDSVQPVLVLSNPSSTNFTVQVMDVFSGKCQVYD